MLKPHYGNSNQSRHFENVLEKAIKWACGFIFGGAQVSRDQDYSKRTPCTLMSFMGGSVGTIPFHVVKRYLIGVKVASFRPVMAMRRSTFAGGEQQADSRFRSSTDATFGKPPAKKQCSCLELVRGTIPGLVDSAHKGQLGRIGVIGGCQE